MPPECGERGETLVRKRGDMLTSFRGRERVPDRRGKIFKEGETGNRKGKGTGQGASLDEGTLCHRRRDEARSSAWGGDVESQWKRIISETKGGKDPIVWVVN